MRLSGALESGDAEATQLGYAPLPAALVKRVESYWSSEVKLPAAGG